MVPNKVKHDLFCWRCHGEKTTLKCRNCIRSYHRKCVSNDQHNISDKENWLCPICVAHEDSQATEKQSHINLLPTLFNQIWNAKQFDSLKHLFTATDCSKSDIIGFIKNPIDLTQIKEKIVSYTSLNEFYNDISWILHNCVILFSENHEKTKAVQLLLESIDGEIDMIKECIECYFNACKYPTQSFTMVCTKPHLIIWAKVKGFSYWPAKIKSIKGEEVNVNFFGDYTCAVVPAKNCCLYSKLSPKSPSKSSPMYKAALKEANEYIENIRKKFGSFKFLGIKSKTNFYPAMLDHYIAQSIPGFHLTDKEFELDKLTVEQLKIVKSCTDKELSVHLNRTDESKIVQSKGPKRIHASDVLNDSPIPKKVRFVDEFGEKLTQVHTIQQSEYCSENDHTDDELLSEMSSITDEMDDTRNDNSTKTQEATPSTPSDGIATSVTADTTSNKSIGSDDESTSTDNDQSIEQKIFERIIKKMKEIQDNVLDLVHLNQLKTLNGTKKMLELSSLRTENQKLTTQLQSLTLERDEAIKKAEYAANIIQQVEMEHNNVIDGLAKAYREKVAKMENTIHAAVKKKAECELQDNQNQHDTEDHMHTDADDEISLV